MSVTPPVPATLEPPVQKQKEREGSDSRQYKGDISSAEEETAQQEGAMEPPEDQEGRSFVEVISEKYSPENFPYRRGPGMGVVVVPTAGVQGSPMKDRLNLPSVLVLNSCGISRAGDQAEIAAFCAHVMELDLSHNKLQDWHEISKIVSSIPNLEFLNLSSNPLAGTSLEQRCAEAFSRVRRLVLNNTQISWDTVVLLTQQIPVLEELFLCLNEYSSVSASSVACPTLRLLHITDNSLHDWAEVRKFGSMFPSLDTLVMANNNLASIQDNKDILQRLFPNLRSINLHNSGLNRWEDIEKLNFFPKLEEVRLQGIPLLQTFTNAERRSLIIAQLPSITLLNGSVVTDTEREDAERFFIRYYADCPEEELPYRYHSLVTKYGKLEPLAEIDLRPRFRAQVEVHCEEKVEQVSIRLDQTVAELKKQLTAVVQLSTNSMRLYYIDKGSAFGPEEMKYNTRALHSYSIQDGDEILVVPKTK
ncbi:tubulin-specific chaperone cofactor E-like protein isoform X1 [Melanotaenia boesemani]|uniref:tubulin-specific chaperone cofactor E-like protein isoform X1 n=2 Tax=Melanotaenia boesemani TaxID=1250792 RepID=UPI001C03ABE4|nr:tubulin-specific chaperone cofactor E-like protein isoform X1 [Melanotaenia boesemani]XP_041850387.1 tubulin-specific chaperone cofactor E-like protein isoform X1 [Melanotaenia boesemani]